MYNKESFTRLTLEQSDKKIVWEVPYEDVDGVNDMMEAINMIMIGMTFPQETIYTAMASYIEEHSNYIVMEKSELKEDEEE